MDASCSSFAANLLARRAITKMAFVTVALFVVTLWRRPVIKKMNLVNEKRDELSLERFLQNTKNLQTYLGTSRWFNFSFSTTRYGNFRRSTSAGNFFGFLAWIAKATVAYRRTFVVATLKCISTRFFTRRTVSVTTLLIQKC